MFFAGLALWGMDWFNEIWNALFFEATGRAPVWSATGPTAYQLLIGLNIEICLMFAVMGVATAKMLPPRDARIFGIPNRPVLVAVYAAAAVGVEILLNQAGVLGWDWRLWQADFPFLIWLFGYATFFVVCFYVHDLPTVRAKARTVGIIFALDAIALAVFGAAGWL